MTRVLAALLLGYVLGAIALNRSPRKAKAAIADDIDWLSEYLLDHTPSPAAARSN